MDDNSVKRVLHAKRALKVLIEETKLCGKYTFSSGIKSNYYVDGRKVSLSTQGAFWASWIIFDLIADLEVDAIGGPTLGADSLVAAVVLRNALEGKNIPGFIVRKNRKKHGTQHWIEGNIITGGTVVMVDDVITTGGSILRAIAKVEENLCEVVKIITLLDWQQGGSDKLREEGYDIVSLLRGDIVTGETFIND